MLEQVATMKSRRDVLDRCWDAMSPLRQYGYWALLILPCLAWFNGPAVSDEQRVIRVGLVVAVVGAVLLDVMIRILNRSRASRTRGTKK